MNPLKLIRVLADAHKAEVVMKGKAAPMQKATQIVALAVQLIGTLGLATQATQWTDHHLLAVVIINLALTVGHALLPSVIPGPVKPNPQISDGGR